MSEIQLIEHLRSAGASRDDVVVGIGDDAAVVEIPAGYRLVACVDALLAGTHFPETISAYHIGWRSLAVNLSDFAAMGAEPRWATLVLSLPQADDDWAVDFARGFDALARLHDVALIGGDTVRGPVSISVQLMGVAASDKILLRSGASAGDDVWVSGFPGDAAAGLAVLEGRLNLAATAADYLSERFLLPTPRIALGQGLVGVASAAIDISDGLYVDSGRVAAASRVGLVIEMERLPVSRALSESCEPSEVMELAATGGDDYELLFTARPGHRKAIESLAGRLNMSCTRIGYAIEEQTVTYVLESERWMPSHTGFDHFAHRSGR
ncbi:MAG: thiamine-phosphate kinase [Gammaproteobacteria bacterium]|nr:thiamine-phosphate kinase [Gammaproteobacteria bacterium]